MATLGNKIAVPAQRSRVDTLKLRRRIILIALITAAAAGVFSAVAWMTKPAAVASKQASGTSPSVALANQVALDYLAGRPTTVPVAKDVPQDFGNTSAKPGLSGNVRPPILANVTTTTMPNGGTLDLVRFYIIVDQDGTNPADGKPTRNAYYYQLSVPMAVNDKAPTPVLAAVPTILPLITANTDTSAADLSTLPNKIESSSISNALSQRVSSWATEYAKSGVDSAALKALTGDQDPNHQYSGLGGWTLATAPQILSAAAPPVNEAGDRQTGIILRVALVMSPPGANGGTVRSEYDVWVQATGSNDDVAPIVAWAPAGSYSLMYPYMNARTT